jgi:hypothetical protein
MGRIPENYGLLEQEIRQKMLRSTILRVEGDMVTHSHSNIMLTPRQQDLIKRFFIGISLLDGKGERQNADLAKRVLHNCVATDLISKLN